MPVELTAPDGTEITKNEVGDTLKGQILYDKNEIDPETGNLMVIKETSVSLRVTALSRVPLPGETWQIKIPLNPAFPTVLTQFLIDTDRSMTDGQSLGFAKLYLKKVVQS
jgi:hypothetical protein